MAAEAVDKFPSSRVISAHYVGALLRNRDYKAGIICFISLIEAFSAINDAINAKPKSVFTYEYLLAACGGSDPRILNYVYYQAMENVTDNAFLLCQYGEFLEEMDQYEAAREVFRKAYDITPTDDLARSVIRVGMRGWGEE